MVPALLKWIGNKQRFAEYIVDCFPESFRNYHEPFLGSGAVLAELSQRNACGAMWPRLNAHTPVTHFLFLSIFFNTSKMIPMFSATTIKARLMITIHIPTNHIP